MHVEYKLLWLCFYFQCEYSCCSDLILAYGCRIFFNIIQVNEDPGVNSIVVGPGFEQCHSAGEVTE